MPTDEIAAREEAPIVCTLGAGDLAQRLTEWSVMLESVAARHPIDGGLRLVFRPGTDAGALATLAAAEQACCTFFRFRITIDSQGVSLDVTAPADATDIVLALFGAPT